MKPDPVSGDPFPVTRFREMKPDPFSRQTQRVGPSEAQGKTPRPSGGAALGTLRKHTAITKDPTGRR